MSVTSSPASSSSASPPASPAPSSTQPPLAIVTRLRAAGCVFAEDEAQLIMSAARTPADVAAMVERRVAGLPLEHIVGWAEFCGLQIAVEPGVFVPRRRSELLVREAVALVTARTGVPAGTPAPRPAVVLDLCCGSGALGAALAAALGPVELHATDIEPACARCARRNVAAAGGRVYQGDLYDPLPATLRGRVDILLANAPYVPTGGIGLLPPEAREHEPRVALDGGADGLAVLRRVAAGAPGWLAPGGHLISETSERQSASLAEAMARAGLIPRVARDHDLNATVVIGGRPGR